MLRPRIINQESENIDIELKFVPARYCNCTFFCQSGQFEGYALTRPWSKVPALGNEGLDIEAVLNEEEDAPETEKSEDEDVIYLAIHNPGHMETRKKKVEVDDSELLVSYSFPSPCIREQIIIRRGSNNLTKCFSGASLSLSKSSSGTTLGDQTIQNAGAIDTSVKYCIQFLSSHIPDASGLFIIRGKRFACEKIEVNMDATGLNKLMTGYFYPLDL